MQEQLDRVLDHWYPWKDWDRHSSIPEGALDLWFNDSQSKDLEITDKFKEDVDEVEPRKRAHWLIVPDGKLAFIILCDQFTRSVYRG